MNFISANSNQTDRSGSRSQFLASPKGLIVFCETKLRYESGWRAWMFLGPYLGLAIFFETVITATHSSGGIAVLQWIGFFVYLILFPSIWGRVLNLIVIKKDTLAIRTDCLGGERAELNAKKSIGLL